MRGYRDPGPEDEADDQFRFEDQFEADEYGLTFRKFGRGRPVRVTPQERDECIDRFERLDALLNQVSFAVLMVWMLAAMRWGGTDVWSQALWISAIAVMVLVDLRGKPATLEDTADCSLCSARSRRSRTNYYGSVPIEGGTIELANGRACRSAWRYHAVADRLQSPLAPSRARARQLRAARSNRTIFGEDLRSAALKQLLSGCRCSGSRRRRAFRQPWRRRARE